MKTILCSLVVLSTLIASSAHAGRSSGMPNTAKMLFQTSGSVGAYDTGLSADALVQKAVRGAEQNIQDIIKGKRAPGASNGFFGAVAGEDSLKPINVEYECQSIYRVWSDATAESKSFAKGDIFDGQMTRTDANVTVSVYCQPRDFRQKVSISAMQACEKEPKVECMSKEYMDAFSKIQQTTYSDINKP
ncbi:MAG: hypothetical protein JWP85_2759 [Rhodoglobus sp.]|nr:hypothetical protein [Rhodoglobus sp.]